MRVLPSAIHRWGVYAEEAIPANRKVIEYTGERISRKETKRRSDAQHRLIYLVPSETKAFDLTCFFATYTIPGIDQPVAPKALTFHLGGPQAIAPSAPNPEQY